ncbi:ATP-binding protein [Chitinophaga sp. S165]|uniref:ATP-binding protein n=1 Tax=Chitinophaga sp. S165 TaxID=2135462 RepID=UPI000D71C4A8|nr:ATP-binding protein [Chitinophaga sp. S165]PWV49143.1 AAA ATPase-like protein [Chitinophaga sp. S165]
MLQRSEESKEFASKMKALLNKQEGSALSTSEGVSAGNPADTIVDEAFTAQLSAATSMAALSGNFSPDDLFSADVPEERRQDILMELSDKCIVDTSGNVMKWLLQQPYRSIELKRMIGEGSLAKHLSDALPETDNNGNMLRSLLRGDQLITRNMNEAQLKDLSFALEVTKDLHLGNPDLARVKNLIERFRFLSDYNVLLSKGFYGRERELANLADFVWDIANRDDKSNFLVLRGAGGSGKSTLLAKFLSTAIEHHDIAIAILDFDKPGIHPSDGKWLDMEVSRQISYQTGDRDNILKESRDRIKDDLQTGSKYYESYSSHYKTILRGYVEDIKEAAIYALQRHSKIRRLLLVLDTFEEVMQRGLFEHIRSWLYDWQHYAAQFDLEFKVIFSGRLSADNINNLENIKKLRDVKVEELDPEAATLMLCDLGVPLDKAGQLAASPEIPRRPLELRLAARVMKANPELSVKELEDELVKAGGKGAKEFFAGVIYKRVLLRISNEIARKIAYPGLILRYVNEEILENILIPALGLGGVSTATIEEGWKELVNCEWLLQKDEHQNWWHRRDIRRSMLKAIWSQEPEQAIRINQQAIAYFEQTNNYVELLYHELMRAGDKPYTPSIRKDRLAIAAKELELYVNDFGRSGRVLFRYLLNGIVDIDDFEWLPKDMWSDAYYRKGQDLIEGRLFRQAFSLLEKYRADTPVNPVANGFYQWEMDALYANVEWQSIAYINPLSIEEKTQMQRLCSYVFPGMIVSDTWYTRRMLTELSYILSNYKYFNVSEELQTGNAGYFSQFCMGLLRCHFSGIDSVADKTSIKEFLSSRLSGHMQVIVTNDRNLFLLYNALNLLSPETRCNVAIKDLNIDPAELAWGTDLEHESVRYFLPRRMEEIYELGELHSAKEILTTVDKKTLEITGAENICFSFDPSKVSKATLFRLYRGPDPEFRDPCRYALEEAFTGQEDFEALAAVFRDILPFNLDELNPASFVALMACNAELCLEDLIELTDRVWKLGQLLERASDLKRHAKKLTMVREAYAAWDTAVNAAINNLQPSSRVFQDYPQVYR